MLVYQRVSIRSPDHPKNAPIHGCEARTKMTHIHLRWSQKLLRYKETVSENHPIWHPIGIPLAFSGSEICGQKWLKKPLAQKLFWSQNEIVDEVPSGNLT
jgi:hypothetical protein